DCKSVFGPFTHQKSLVVTTYWKSSTPIARYPHPTTSSRSPSASHPHRVRVRCSHVMSADPNPVSLPNPISWHPDVRWAGGRHDCLGPRWWWRLFDNDFGRRSNDHRQALHIGWRGWLHATA